MSDLLAPILYVMQNEVDAFWCFVGFMEKVSNNFDFDTGGIKHQVSRVGLAFEADIPVAGGSHDPRSPERVGGNLEFF